MPVTDFSFFVTTKLLQSTTTFWRLSHILNPTQSFLCVCAVSSSMRISPDFPGALPDFWSYICGVPQTTDRCCCAVPAPLPAAEAAAISWDEQAPATPAAANEGQRWLQ